MNNKLFFLLGILLAIFMQVNSMAADLVSTENMTSDQQLKKIIFIHHSVGGYWLADDYGGLTKELNDNNYYVSDVTYGWEPQTLKDTFVKKIVHKIRSIMGQANRGAFGIGNRTDIGQMYDWFLGPDSAMIMDSIYRVNSVSTTFGVHRNQIPISRDQISSENEIVIFKSCFPNTLLTGRPSDLANDAVEPIVDFTALSHEHTVANAKRTFNDLLNYFSAHPNKFFVIITPPPQIELPHQGKVARGFCNWLVNDWLTENKYNLKNVMVFDLYNILTSSLTGGGSDEGKKEGNHHRIMGETIEHIVQTNNNTLVYYNSKTDNHPSAQGLQKATAEFVPVLNYYLKKWKEHADD